MDRKKAISKIKTKLWFYFLSKQAGDRTAYWFAKHCRIGSNDERTWARYKKGESLPRVFKGIDPVAEMEKLYPGSESIFRRPLWDILNGEVFTYDSAQKEFENFGPTLRAILKGSGIWPYEVAEDGSIQISELIHQLTKVNQYETLEAIMILMAAADTVQNTKVRSALDAAYRQMIPHLILNDSIPFIGELFDVIDLFSCPRDYAHGFEMKDQPKFWRDELPRYKEILTEHYVSCLSSFEKYLGTAQFFLTLGQTAKLAAYMADHACADEKSTLRSAEMWSAFRWAFAKLFQSERDLTSISDQEVDALMRKEVSYYLEEKSRPEIGVEFRIEFRG